MFDRYDTGSFYDEMFEADGSVQAHCSPLLERFSAIPPGDFDELYAAGATAIFPPGTVIADAAIGLLHKLAERLGYTLK